MKKEMIKNYLLIIFLFVLGFENSIVSASEDFDIESQNSTRHYPYFFSADFMRLDPDLNIQQVNFKNLDNKTIEKLIDSLNLAGSVLADVRYDLCDIEKYSKKHPELAAEFKSRVPKTFRKMQYVEESLILQSDFELREGDGTSHEALELFKWALQDPDQKIFRDIINYLEEERRLANTGAATYTDFFKIFTETSKESNFFKETSAECPEIINL